MKFVCAYIFLIQGGVVGEGCRDKEATISLRQVCIFWVLNMFSQTEGDLDI